MIRMPVCNNWIRMEETFKTYSLFYENIQLSYIQHNLWHNCLWLTGFVGNVGTTVWQERRMWGVIKTGCVASNLKNKKTQEMFIVSLSFSIEVQSTLSRDFHKRSWWGWLKRSSESLSPPSQAFTPHGVSVKQPALWKTPPTPHIDCSPPFHLAEGTGAYSLSLPDNKTSSPRPYDSATLRDWTITSVALFYAVLRRCFVFVWCTIAPHVNNNNDDNNNNNINNHIVTL